MVTGLEEPLAPSDPELGVDEVDCGAIGAVTLWTGADGAGLTAFVTGSTALVTGSTVFVTGFTALVTGVVSGFVAFVTGAATLPTVAPTLLTVFARTLLTAPRVDETLGRFVTTLARPDFELGGVVPAGDEGTRVPAVPGCCDDRRAAGPVLECLAPAPPGRTAADPVEARAAPVSDEWAAEAECVADTAPAGEPLLR